tara:strand:- start:442 stop:573 length:132 start_codon:yes stop_codon:yes gene_type:complete
MSIYDDIVKELRETARIILNRIENIEKKLGIDVNKIDKEDSDG